MLETLDYKIPMTTKAPLPVISVRGAGRGVGTQVIVRRGHRSLLPGTGGRCWEREDRDTTVTPTQESEVNILATWNRSY